MKLVLLKTYFLQTATCRVPNGDKIDMYDFGVILLEVITGRPISSIYEVEIMKEQVWSLLTFTLHNGLLRYCHTLIT
jgi:hypothetical protein